MCVPGLNSVRVVPVGGPPRQSPGGGRAVAGVVSAGSVSARPRAPLRRVRIRARTAARAPPHRLAAAVRRRLRPRVSVAGGTVARLRCVRVRVILLGGTSAAVRGVADYVIARTRNGVRREGRCRAVRPSGRVEVGFVHHFVCVCFFF